MKKFLLLFFISATVSTATADSGMYSSDYLNNLKTCTPFKETRNTNLPIGGESGANFALITKEAVLGWKNGKCVTLSKAYSPDLDQVVLASRCAFSQSQLDSVVKKINQADNGNQQALQDLKTELQQYIQDGSTCMVKTFLGDDD